MVELLRCSRRECRSSRRPLLLESSFTAGGLVDLLAECADLIQVEVAERLSFVDFLNASTRARSPPRPVPHRGQCRSAPRHRHVLHELGVAPSMIAEHLTELLHPPRPGRRRSVRRFDVEARQFVEQLLVELNRHAVPPRPPSSSSSTRRHRRTALDLVQPGRFRSASASRRAGAVVRQLLEDVRSTSFPASPVSMGGRLSLHRRRRWEGRWSPPVRVVVAEVAEGLREALEVAGVTRCRRGRRSPLEARSPKSWPKSPKWWCWPRLRWT